MRRSAALARLAAPAFCRPDQPSRSSCEWYHGFWPYLRILGLASTPQRHADFYRAAVADAARSRAESRVLVCGSADYAMLAAVAGAGASGDVQHKFAVVDLCETPLLLCRWYAKLESIPLATYAADIVQWTPEQPFDVACTHSLLPHFRPAERAGVIAAWRRILRPGGRVVTVARVDPDWAPERVKFSREQVEALVATVVERARALQEPLDINAEELSRRAQAYAGRIESYPFESANGVAALFESGGFRIESLRLRTLEAGAGGVSGPTVRKAGPYAEIVAIRT